METWRVGRGGARLGRQPGQAVATRGTLGCPLMPSPVASHDTLMPLCLFACSLACHAGERDHSSGLDRLGLESQLPLPDCALPDCATLGKPAHLSEAQFPFL